MPVDRQARNIEWDVSNVAGVTPSWVAAAVAVLMDIRREIQTLNRLLLACPNFQAIPGTLKTISQNTARPKKKKRAR